MVAKYSTAEILRNNHCGDLNGIIREVILAGAGWTGLGLVAAARRVLLQLRAVASCWCDLRAVPTESELRMSFCVLLRQSAVDCCVLLSSAASCFSILPVTSS